MVIRLYARMRGGGGVQVVFEVNGARVVIYLPYKKCFTKALNCTKLCIAHLHARINEDRTTIAVMNSLHAPLRKDVFELSPSPLCLPDN